MLPYFPPTEPHEMPKFLFFDHLKLDYKSAVKADIARQNFSVQPRYWYINATFLCRQCRKEFCFTTAEQKVWYEEHQFYVDSLPKQCPVCRRERRKLNATRKEYNESIAAALESENVALKQRLITLIDELCELDEKLPEKIFENRRILGVQIARSARAEHLE